MLGELAELDTAQTLAGVDGVPDDEGHGTKEELTIGDGDDGSTTVFSGFQYEVTAGLDESWLNGF